MKLNSIDELYQFLEISEDYGEDSSFIKDFSELRDHYKNEGIQEIADKIQLELIASEFYLVKGELRGKYQFKDNTGKLVESPDFKLLTEENFDYYNKRIPETQNSFIKARYNHLIWQKGRHFKNLKESIDNYFISAKILEEKDIESPDKYFGLRITSIIKTVIYIAQYAQKEEGLKNRIKDEIKNLIFNFNFKSSSLFFATSRFNRNFFRI